jgi:predicted component of type VI protein secretion system
MLVLQHLQKDGSEKRYRLEKLPVIVGRIERAQILIPEPSVSREHLRIFERDGLLHIADLNSSNGTFVNGKRVTCVPVAPGDEIRLGAARLKVAEEGAAPPTKKEDLEPPREAQGSEPSGTVDELRLPGEVSEPGPPRKDRPPPKPAPLQETRAHRIDSPVREPARGAPASARDPGDIKVKQDLLQFHRIDPRKGRTVLADEFSQYGGVSRFLILLLLAALAVGGFFFFRWLGETVTPDAAGIDGGVQSVEDQETGSGSPDRDGF